MQQHTHRTPAPHRVEYQVRADKCREDPPATRKPAPKGQAGEHESAGHQARNPLDGPPLRLIKLNTPLVAKRLSRLSVNQDNTRLGMGVDALCRYLQPVKRFGCVLRTQSGLVTRRGHQVADPAVSVSVLGKRGGAPDTAPCTPRL